MPSRRCTSCARSAISRTFSTSPRTSSSTGAAARARRGGLAAAPRQLRLRARARARNGRNAQALLGWFARARVAPVLAHPTEVQRRAFSIASARSPGSFEASSESEQALHAEILRLWLTAMLRGTRLEVADEVANGLAYFRLTFLNELPRLYAELSARCRRASLPAEPRACRPSSPWAPGSAATATAILMSTRR